MYKSIFLKTAGGLALVALVTAQGYDYANENFTASFGLLAIALLGAIIGGLIAVGWAFATSPAVTPLGRALREAVQMLLGLPIAGAILNLTNDRDIFALGPLVVPTIIAVILAFAVAYLRNLGAVPPTGNTATGPDFTGTAPAPQQG